MRILLDENMAEPLRRALADLGHEVDSVASLRLKGLDNGRRYQDVAQGYDLCFSKDRRFVHSVRAIDRPGPVKVLRVTIAQAPRGRFTSAFVEAFRLTEAGPSTSGGVGRSAWGYCDLHNGGATGAGDHVDPYVIEEIDCDAIVERSFFDTGWLLGSVLLAGEEASPGRLLVTRQAWRIAAHLRPEMSNFRWRFQPRERRREP